MKLPHVTRPLYGVGVMDSVQTKRKPNNSFQNSYHAEGNVKVCMRIYNEWELCRVPSISFHRLHL